MNSFDKYNFKLYIKFNKIKTYNSENLLDNDIKEYHKPEIKYNVK